MVFSPPSVWAVKTKVALYLSGSRAASVAIGSLAALVFAGVRLALLDRFVFRLELATGVRWQAPIAKSKSESKSESRKTKPGLFAAAVFISTLSTILRRESQST